VSNIDSVRTTCNVLSLSLSRSLMCSGKRCDRDRDRDRELASCIPRPIIISRVSDFRGERRRVSVD